MTTSPAKWGHSTDMYKWSLTWFCAKQELSTCVLVCECVYIQCMDSKETYAYVHQDKDQEHQLQTANNI